MRTLPAAFLLLLPAIVSSQPGSASLTGVVRDESGGPVPGASISAVDASAGRRRTTMTSRAGVYTFAAISPGTYNVAVSMPEFRPLTQEGVRIQTGETVRIDLVILPGTISESVTVIAETPLLRTETASLDRVVDHQTIVQLPLNGRSFISLAALAPGVALPPGSTLPRINGGRPRTNEYLFDGISVLQPEPGQVAFFPVVDAIEEFTIESNSPPAEFGRFNGGVVNLTTRAGTNALRGSAFEFFRHERLNARNFFASTDPVKPLFRRNQFGGVLGGPIRRNRTFFFGDYQGTRQAIGRTAISTVPTLLQRQGIFTEPIGGRVPVIYDPATTSPASSGDFVRTPFAENRIPIDRVDARAASLLAHYPLPTSAGTANNFRRVATERNLQDQFDVRLDHQLAPRGDLLFARVSSLADAFTPVTPLPDGSGTTTGTLGPQDTRARSFAATYRRPFGGAWLNEIRAGDTRRSVARRATAVGGGAARGFTDVLPTVAIAGYQQLGSPANTATDFNTSVSELADTLTWVHGTHTTKFGIDFRWERLNVFQPPSPAGAYQFSTLFTDLPGSANTGASLASFLLGQVQTFSIDLQEKPIRNRARIQEYFAQDEWKVSDRVTLNGGLRYTLNFPSYEEHDQAAVFNLETQTLEYLGRDGNPRTARALHKLNIGPRIGATGRVGGQSVVRLGYGMVWIEMAGITTPFTTPVFPFLQTVSQRTLDSINPAFVLTAGPSIAPIPKTPLAGLGQGVFSVDRALGSGYVQQWNLSFQRTLSATTSFELAYVGSRITHVGIPDTNLNQLSVDQLALGTALQQRVPNPYYGSMPASSTLGDPTIPVAQLLKPYARYTTVSLYRNNVGNTNYHGVTARLEQRVSRGLSYSIAYTRSKLMDDASSVFDASILTGPVANSPVADSFNRRLERDVSTGDIPNVMVAHAIWELPKTSGLTLSAIFTLQSGIPLAVTQLTNFNSFAGFGTQRPNRSGDPGLPAGERTPARWFDVSALSVAPPFTLGNSSRNPVRGPGYRNIDVAVSRHARLAKGMGVELRAEAFNVLNTPALGAPNVVVGSAGFGSITSAGDPRVLQLAVKVSF